MDHILSPPPGTVPSPTTATAPPPATLTSPDLAVVGNDDAETDADDDCDNNNHWSELAEAAGIGINPFPPLIIPDFALTTLPLPLPLLTPLPLYPPPHRPQCSSFRNYPHHFCRRRHHH